MSIGVIGFIYALAAWELGNFVFHWTCHKVRLLWCMHSAHHAPSHINVSVGATMFFYEATYSVFVRTVVCSALGVPLPLLILAMAVDGLWGSLIHISEETWKSGRLPGFLGRAFFCPAHHRLHHACNPEYIDRNFCNLLPIWDRLFGTYQDEIKGVRTRYGITRPLKPDSLVDLYFGEFQILLRDVVRARSVWTAILYVVMPPAWQPHYLRAAEAK